MIIGLFGLLVYFVIGAGVAAIERRKGEGWELTVIGACGAISGAWVGRSFDLYVAFGEISGVFCAVAGALVLLRVSRSLLLGMRTSDTTLTASADSQLPPRAPTAPPPAPPERSETIVNMLAEAFGWGIVCAFTTGAAGFAGHLLGSHVYPQRYEQIPSDFFFVPMGMLIGFVAAGVARLAARDWGVFGMAAFVCLVSVGYADVMFQYSRNNAVRAATTTTPSGMSGSVPARSATVLPHDLATHCPVRRPAGVCST